MMMISQGKQYVKWKPLYIYIPHIKGWLIMEILYDSRDDLEDIVVED